MDSPPSCATSPPDGGDGAQLGWRRNPGSGIRGWNGIRLPDLRVDRNPVFRNLPAERNLTTGIYR
jgi:hypothetical protein